MAVNYTIKNYDVVLDFEKTISNLKILKNNHSWICLDAELDLIIKALQRYR